MLYSPAGLWREHSTSCFHPNLHIVLWELNILFFDTDFFSCFVILLLKPTHPANGESAVLVLSCLSTGWMLFLPQLHRTALKIFFRLLFQFYQAEDVDGDRGSGDCAGSLCLLQNQVQQETFLFATRGCQFCPPTNLIS